MFGNKFSGDEIAKEFHRKMGSLKKEAADKTAELNPEEFLVAPQESEGAGDAELSSQIDSVSSYANDADDTGAGTAVALKEPTVSDADDKKCECEGDDCECCKDCGKADCECSKNDAEDFMSSNAEFVLHELGKMAGRLRIDNHAFAADMVEATAMSIKDDLVKEASQKLKVVSGLEKMAESMYHDGDNFTGDLLKATLEQIKKS